MFTMFKRLITDYEPKFLYSYKFKISRSLRNVCIVSHYIHGYIHSRTQGNPMRQLNN